MNEKPLLIWAMLLLAGMWAGAQNALAGGGSFVTLGALIIAGIDPKLANIVSTVAMFPGQVVSGWAGRRLVGATASAPLRLLVPISFTGGAAGALLLLLTPSLLFAWLVPWLVLFATILFAASARGGACRNADRVRSRPASTLALQFAVAVYGGYYSGGIGFLMLAVLSLAGTPIHSASAIKNILAAVLNSSAVIIFLITVRLPLPPVVALSAGAIAGNAWGVWLLKRIDPKMLTFMVIGLGLALSVGLFLRSP